MEDPDSLDHRRILLDAALYDVPEDKLLATAVVKGQTVGAALEDEADVKWVEHTLQVDYSYWPATHVLRVRHLLLLNVRQSEYMVATAVASGKR